MATQAAPARILEVGFGFWPSKVLLTGVELGLFTTLGAGRMSGQAIGEALGLHPRGIWDFLDALVALGFLGRDGDGPEALYSNTADTAQFLDRNQPTYIGGILEMASARLFRFWADLGPALQTGLPQNEIKHDQRSVFEVLYEDPARLEQFLAAMRGISTANFQAFADKFDFNGYRTLCDVGGATGLLSSLVARRQPQIHCTSFDLPVVEPIARRWVEKDGLADRVRLVSGDFMKDALPKADIITMGMILHDWNLEHKRHLIRLAYEALPQNGAFVAIENIIDDARRSNAFGLMMSLNMLIEFGNAFDFTGADFNGWCREAGFRRFDLLHLNGPCSAAIAYK
jgi:predicted O-methyltransferase YrrM